MAQDDRIDDAEAIRDRSGERVRADVFISYKRMDRPKIAALAAALRRMGIEVWFDLSIRTGDRFDDVIEANARACKAMVVCWTNACFAQDDSGYVTFEASIGRDREVLAPIAIEPLGSISFQDDWDRFHIEDLSHWLIAPPAKDEGEQIDRVGEHGALSDAAFMRLLDKLGEPALLNRPGLAELSRVYAAFTLAGEPDFNGPRKALETAVTLGRRWLLDHQADPAAERLARDLVDYEYAALGAQITQDYGRFLGQWTPPGAEAMRRERGLENQRDKLQREIEGKNAFIAQLQLALDRLKEAEKTAKPGLFGRRDAAASPDARAALEAVETAAREAERLDIRRPGALWRDRLPALAPDALPEMVTLPPGRFLMGSPKGEGGDSERPQHEVRIAYGLAMSKFPVTFGEWDSARGAGAKLENPYDRGWGRDRRPVINISWEDAQVYLEWLNAELGLSGRVDAYRLPSEAEWEYACRAGTTTRYSFGDAITKAQAQFSEGSAGSAKQTVPVGSFPANGFGLHDMHGNVWEWCGDAWNDSYNGAPNDGAAWLTGDQSSRVLRGGSWDLDPQLLRSALRNRNHPPNRYDSIGFRLARTVFTP